MTLLPPISPMLEPFAVPQAKANQSSAAVHNRQLVLNLLRQQGPLSRRQIGRITGLRGSTVTYISRELESCGVIRPGGKRASKSVGKKQTLLEVSPDFGWVIGVGVEGDTASLVFLNAAGELIERDRFALATDLTLLPETLHARVEAWRSRKQNLAGDLLGVGIGFPGVVDPQQGIVRSSTPFQAVDFPVRQAIQDVFNRPVFVDNDVNCAVFAEARTGSASDLSHFIYFLVNARPNHTAHSLRSLGSALFLNGSLYRGAHFGAGEIDAFLANQTVGDADTLGHLTDAEVIALARSDADLSENLQTIGRRIGTMLSAIVDLLDPQAVILGGNVCLNNHAMIELVQQELNQRLVKLPGRRVIVRPSEWMEHGVTMGAAISAADLAFSEHVAAMMTATSD